MTSESFVDKWKEGRKIFAIILIVDLAAISIAVFLPAEYFTITPVENCSNITELIDGAEESNQCSTINQNPAIFTALAIIIIVSLVGFLAFFNRMSHSSDLTKGEMRKTFAITIIMIYLLVMALIVTGHIEWNENNKLVENFTYVVITVIIFYFGSRTFKQARDSVNSSNIQRNNASEDSEENTIKTAEADEAEAILAMEKTENQITEVEIKIDEAENENEKTSAETELKDLNEKLKKEKDNVDTVKKKTESQKNKLADPKERLAKIEKERELNELKKTVLELKKKKTIPKIHTSTSIETVSSNPENVQTLMDDIISEFEQYITQNPNARRDIINHYAEKFTQSVSRLIRQRNESIESTIDNLDTKDPEFPTKKQKLLEQKTHVTNNLAIRTTDREKLNTRLNEILHKSASNLSTKKIINGIDLTDKSPREISRLISEGKIPPMLLGPKSPEMLKQELTSMLQSYEPSTITSEEKGKFLETLEIRIEEILTLPDGNIRNELLDIVDQIKKNK